MFLFFLSIFITMTKDKIKLKHQALNNTTKNASTQYQCINGLSENLKKWLLPPRIYNRPSSVQELLSELTNYFKRLALTHWDFDKVSIHVMEIQQWLFNAQYTSHKEINLIWAQHTERACIDPLGLWQSFKSQCEFQFRYNSISHQRTKDSNESIVQSATKDSISIV